MCQCLYYQIITFKKITLKFYVQKTLKYSILSYIFGLHGDIRKFILYILQTTISNIQCHEKNHGIQLVSTHMSQNSFQDVDTKVCPHKNEKKFLRLNRYTSSNKFLITIFEKKMGRLSSSCPDIVGFGSHCAVNFDAMSQDRLSC